MNEEETFPPDLVLFDEVGSDSLLHPRRRCRQGLEPRRGHGRGERIQQCVRWCLDGGFASRHPESSGFPVRIEVSCQAGVRPEVAGDSAARRDRLSKRGIGFFTVEFEEKPSGESWKHSW